MPLATLSIALCALPYNLSISMPQEPINRVVTLVERLRLDQSELRSFYDLDFDPSNLDRLDRFYAESKQPFSSFGAPKNVEEKIDLDLAKNFLEYRQLQIGFQKTKLAETDALLPFASKLIELELRRRKMEQIDPQATADELVSIKKLLDETRAGLQKSIDGEKPLPNAVVADRSAKRLERLSQTFEFWFKQYDGFHPLFSWWAKKPYDALASAMRDYVKFLREKLAGYKEGEDAPLIGDPIGREALLVDMKAEMLEYSPEDLLAMADREFAWCETEAKKAAKEMGFGDNWKAAMEKVKTLHVKPGEQDQLVARQAREAIDFVESRNLVTIEPLCKETWRLEMLNQDTQKVLPFAVYLGQRMGVSFPLSTQDHETKEMSLRGNNEHFTRAITHHELIPGHHLQGYMAERYNSHRRLFSTPFLVEGWALYWEMLLWDLSFPRGPEDRLGMLFWRMHRCARIIVSLKFHLGQMTPPQMIDFLVERVNHERFTATSEVRRFIGGDYSPLYQCAYMIGGLQIRELETQLVKSGKMSHRQFHDAILHSGPIPIKLVGERLRNAK
jgi:hypothetical protein